MSDATRSDINPIGRKPAVTIIDATPNDGNGVADGERKNTSGIGEPEVFIFSPETVRIGTADDSFGSSADTFGADGIRRTKRGTVDRRTRAGRSSDAGNAPQETTGKSSLDSLSVADLLVSINGFLATLTEIPEFEISDDEAKALAKAVQDVGKHYAVNFDPKKVAWANLSAVVGKLAWYRVLAYRIRKSSESETKTVKEPAPGPVRVPPQPKTAAQAPNPKQQTNGVATLPSELWNEPAADGITIGL